MRASFLTTALLTSTACLAVFSGCDDPVADRSLADLPAPRVNLYPLSSPPPGTVQPLQGYAPPRIQATQYGPEVYRDGGGNVELAERNPAELNLAGLGDPFGGNLFGANPAVTAEVTYAEGAPAFATTPAAALGFSTDPNDPNSPYYCPPGSEFCPVPGGPAGAPTSATPAATFGLPAEPSAAFGAPAPGTVIYAQTPAVTYPQTTTVYAAAAPPAAPVYTTAAYTTASSMPPATSAATMTAVYTPPVYAPPAYTPPAPRAPAAQYPARPGVSTQPGEVEGTADIVGPLPSLAPIVRPAPGAYGAPALSPAQQPAYPSAIAPAGYTSPYTQPLSMSPSAPAAPIPAAAVVPAGTTATAVTQTAERPSILLSSTARPAIRRSAAGAPSAPASAAQSDVAGVSVAGAGAYKLVPAPDVPPGNHPNDFGPSQWFEVLRPAGVGPVRIGRLSVTCTCVGARIPKRYYGADERILVEARMLSKPAANGVTYGLYVNILEPAETVVDADVTLRY